jgi:hypothetical protein
MFMYLVLSVFNQVPHMRPKSGGSMSVQSQNETTSFDVDDVIERLGVTVLTESEVAQATVSTHTALAEFRAAPTIKAIGRDLARVAATTSDSPEGARKRWLDRLVMTRNTQGQMTDMPLIVGVAFQGQRQIVDGVEDIGVGVTMDVSGLRRINIQPLFTVLPAGVAYIAKSPTDETLIPTRRFYGVLFAPKSKTGAYKFVPLEFADPMLIHRWNDIIEQGENLGSVHKNWPKITSIENTIGKPCQRLLELTPKYMVEKKFPRRRQGEVVKDENGRAIMDSEWRIATRFLKVVVLHPNSQNIPQNTSGNTPFGKFIFSYVERENSILVMLCGRPGEVDTSSVIATIAEIGEQMNPFNVLDTTVEHFEAAKAKSFVDQCLKMRIRDDNLLYRKAVELGLVIPGQHNMVIRAQLSVLADEAIHRAEFLWNEAMEATWNRLRRFSIPTIKECLNGATLAQIKTCLNPEDVAAAWISSHITGEFSWRSPFFRTLREKVLNAAAERIGYHDPEPEAPKTDDTLVNQEPVEASKTDGASGENKAAKEKPAKPKRERKPRTGGRKTKIEPPPAS